MEKRYRYEKLALTLKAWDCPVLTGWKCLIRCAAIAAQHEEWGEAWTPMGVAQEAASLMGKQQHAVWRSMDYTLHCSHGPRTVSEAIKALVKAVKE